MKVLHCISTLGIGGVETRVLNQMSFMASADQSIEHVLCAFSPGKQLERAWRDLSTAGVPLIVLDKTRFHMLKFIREFRRVVKREAPDIIHAFNFGPCLWTRLLLGNHKAKILCHYGGISNVGTRFGRWLERRLLQRTDACVYNSNSTRRIYDYRLHIDCPEFVVHNGIAFPSEEQIDADIRHYDGQRPFVLLSLSRVTPIKSIETQIRTLAVLLARKQNVRLLVVGDGSSISALKTLAGELGVLEHVSFEGFQIDVHRYYRQADVFLCTSYNETFCLSLCEAMYHRLVCIAPNVGGPSEIITNERDGYLLPGVEPPPPALLSKLQPLVYNGHTGELSPPRSISPNLLADRITDIMTHYNELDELRRQTRRKVIDKFSMNRYCNDLIKIYQSMSKQL